MSATVALQDYDYFARLWLLDIEGGTLTAVGEVVTHGLVTRSVERTGQPTFAAVYAEAGDVWFQSDADRWPVESIQVDHAVSEDETHASGIVTAAGTRLAEFSYPNPANDPVNRMDPTFTDVELEASDFFLYLARCTRRPEWRERVLEYWTAGVPPTRGSA